MIPFLAGNGSEFLLLSGKTTGRVIRLDPNGGQSIDVVTGLNGPSALVIDPVTRDLLVGEADKLSIIPRAQLESGLSQSSGAALITRQQPTALFIDERADGLTLDSLRGTSTPPTRKPVSFAGVWQRLERSRSSCPTARCAARC